MASVRNLKVWQLGMDLAVEVYRLCKCLPADEQFALGDQLRRAAVSIPSNIAEGYARNSPKAFKQFIQIATGSRAEVQTQLLLAERTGMLSHEQIRVALALTEDLGGALHSLAEAQERKVASS